ncbi:trimeric LpxA-like protein [Plectosphaerella cucumerina]|uniref:Dynactin subunit 6 n=1 Tax=Plectosphaerella cucumerina TaxID=40658 RepID=A0A8K0T3Z2_9PEZI|nr:trimeric LpxA-like protein [Plectosphaerella cucumerina]
MSTSTSSKRRSILPPVSNSGPQAPVNASSSSKISDNSILTGSHSITIQSESIVHPRAKLESTSGSVLVGRRCIIHERTHIGATDGDESSGGVALGDYVTVEVGSVIEAGGTDIGEGTVVGVRARIGRGAVIGKNCTITPQSIVAPGEKLPDFTVLYSNGRRRLDQRGITDLRHRAQVRQVDVLRKLIPSTISRKPAAPPPEA